MTKRRRRVILLCVGVLVALGLALPARLKPPLYTVTVLPSLGGGITTPFAINDRGQVAGFSEIGVGTSHLFLWDRAGGMRNMGLTFNNIAAMNNAGQIAGTHFDSNHRGQAVLWDPNEGSRRIEAPGGLSSEACAINNLGQVVGTFGTPPYATRAFIWDKTGGMRDLGPGRAEAVNDAGQVVVYSPTGVLLVETGDAAGTRLQVPGMRVLGIDNQGCVRGVSQTAPGKIDLVAWHPQSGLEVLADIGKYAGGVKTTNDANQALITYGTRPIMLLHKVVFGGQLQSYLRDPRRGLISLDRYLRSPGEASPSVMGMNKHGCIIATIPLTDRNRNQAVLLEPIPERWGGK